jgi:pyruvate/2-oxoglutarate/acetoin dehydrogenase E1 component
LTVRMPYGPRPATGQTLGGGAAAQHSQAFYSVLAHVPGLKCIVPTTAYNAKGLMISAIRDNGPVIFFENRYLGTAARMPVPEDPYTLPLGKAEVVRRGRDVTLVGIGRMTHLCVAAAEQLAGSGIQAEVVDVLSLVPLDEATILESVEHTKRLVVVDEDTPVCSMGRDIAARMADAAFDMLDAPIKVINSANTPVPYSATLEGLVTPTSETIVGTVLGLLGRSA